ncbi:hypothetical protein BOSE62_40025 [Bosea sp. 62]|nr:hypothetical protein BOSE46_120764 [Bosea sp. 46]CAD5265188.1 hypothetical protein BOSE21B_111003 [Bosea sp. 21B]CAD5275147.1 hypothetical protein BOSE7B_40212 [Bosea sp. 7B]VVT59185.1 hypothetical protein BOS5A_201052 [Bosea sp. EC-HK365B]VXB72565.1 hypothetical protein BOSE29B_120075 [Bosea sp. 29B]VXC12201.1 hypothetical protein BOSE125_170070 [Bosea sp. 125]VXC29218.1 hypothetical protein BOSE62_40025 [Bosea sp. 62]VXC74958.1 hypothetical protein BOSE127_40388 [Bosea sp. 127]
MMRPDDIVFSKRMALGDRAQRCRRHEGLIADTCGIDLVGSQSQIERTGRDTVPYVPGGEHHQRDGNARLNAAKAPDSARHERGCQGRERSDPDLAGAMIAYPRRACAQFVHSAEVQLDLGEELHAFRGCDNATFNPVEEKETQGSFEIGDRSADGWLADPERFGGAGHCSDFDDCQKNLDQPSAYRIARILPVHALELARRSAECRRRLV